MRVTTPPASSTIATPATTSHGFSTQHYVLDDLMHVLKGDAATPPRRLRSKRYLNSALLVIDEVGFRPLDRQEANLFFRLVSARYEKARSS